MNVVEELNEGITALDEISVNLERLRHRTYYMEQQLEDLKVRENQSSYRRLMEWIRR